MAISPVYLIIHYHSDALKMGVSVNVVLPENDPFARSTLPSSAAVAIRARWDADLTDTVPQIKSLVKNAIEGLSHEKISVTVFQDMPPK